MSSINRKEEIIQVACNLFQKRGYTAVTVRDIAAQMGIKASSLYNHISSKQELLELIVMHLARTFTSEMRAIVISPMRATEQVQMVIQQHVALSAQNTASMAVLNKDWVHLEGALEEFIALRSEYENLFRSLIEKGQSNGEFQDIDVEVVVYATLNTLRNLYLWIPKKTVFNTSQLANDLTKVLLRGIVK